MDVIYKVRCFFRGVPPLLLYTRAAGRDHDVGIGLKSAQHGGKGSRLAIASGREGNTAQRHTETISKLVDLQSGTT